MLTHSHHDTRLNLLLLNFSPSITFKQYHKYNTNGGKEKGITRKRVDKADVIPLLLCI